MSWGTYYKHTGYLSHIYKEELWEKKDECNRINDMLWNEILALMAATPPTYAENEEGHKYPYAEFLAMKIKSYRDEIEENARLVARIDECIDVNSEHPEDVENG